MKNIKKQIKFMDFLKAIDHYAKKNFSAHSIEQGGKEKSRKGGRGSAVRIKLYKEKTDFEPSIVLVIHRKEYINRKYLSKTRRKLDLNKKEFLILLNDS